MPKFPILQPLKTKASLRNWFENSLKPQLVGKAALATQMKAEMGAFEAAFCGCRPSSKKILICIEV